MRKKWLISVCLIFILTFIAAIVTAEPNKAQEDELEKAFAEAEKAQIKGPAEIPLLKQGKIKLSEKYTFIPQPQAGKLMKSMGNSDSPNLIGLVFPLNDEEDWFVIIGFEKSGYIKDDDAKDWDAKELLQSIKEGKERKKEIKSVRKKAFPNLKY